MKKIENAEERIENAEEKQKMGKKQENVKSAVRNVEEGKKNRQVEGPNRQKAQPSTFSRTNSSFIWEIAFHASRGREKAAPWGKSKQTDDSTCRLVCIPSTFPGLPVLRELDEFPIPGFEYPDVGDNLGIFSCLQTVGAKL